jgi:hypothetical protein
MRRTYVSRWKKVVGMALLLGTVLMGSGCGCLASGKPGDIGVIRNGGPFDNSNIRGILSPGAGNTNIGWDSNVHFYPDSSIQRYYTISSNPGEGDRPGVDVVNVPTADGINVGIEGTLYFTTAFDTSSAGEALVRTFDTQYGLRTYPEQGSTGSTHVWAGDTGWSSFLDAVFRPVIDNELRQAMATVKCEELVASCALVTQQGANATASQQTNGNTNVNIQAVQDAVNKGLQTDIDNTLGHAYFTHIQFRLSRVTLPGQVQTAISTAQAAFAQVAEARAKVQTAQQQADANALLAKQYKQYPVLAQIEMVKNLPDGANVFFGVSPSLAVTGK